MSDSLGHHALQHTRLPCPSLSLRLCSNSCPLSWWCHPNISSSATPFSSCPQFSSIRVFSNKIVNSLRSYNLSIYIHILYLHILMIKSSIRPMLGITIPQSAKWNKRSDWLRGGVAWQNSGNSWSQRYNRWQSPGWEWRLMGRVAASSCQPVSKFCSGIFMLRQGKNKDLIDL